MKLKYQTGSLTRRRFYARNSQGIPSWSCRIYAKHENVKLGEYKGVVEVIFSNNKKLRLDKIDKKKFEKMISYSGFIESEKPINNCLLCYREEWIFE